MSIGTVAIRGVAGPLFIGHGTQKLFGWFGGHGLEGTAGFFENIDLRPGRRNAIAAGTAEALGGVLLTLGAFTPLAATMISSTMITAIRKVHARHGPWVTEQGYEYNAVLVATMMSVVESGPGRPSIDARLFPNWKGSGWAVASIGAAVAGSYLVDLFNEPAPPEAPQAASAGDPASTEEGRFTKETSATPQAS
jgi:putative oxidoreductase